MLTFWGNCDVSSGFGSPGQPANWQTVFQNDLAFLGLTRPTWLCQVIITTRWNSSAHQSNESHNGKVSEGVSATCKTGTANRLFLKTIFWKKKLVCLHLNMIRPRHRNYSQSHKKVYFKRFMFCQVYSSFDESYKVRLFVFATSSEERGSFL